MCPGVYGPDMMILTPGGYGGDVDAELTGSSNEPATVGDLDESALLARIFPKFKSSASVLLGPGDDAAIVAVPDGRTVASIDTQVQDKDFRLSWPNGYVSTGYDVGWKAAAQNLSDINAMGAEPTSLVVSLTMPSATPVSWVEGLADGLAAAIEMLGAADCSVAGGDLSAGSEIVVTVAVLGSLAGREPVLRSGARPGDVLALAGTVGRAAAGWSLLESDEPVAALTPAQRSLLDTQCRPWPPLAAGPLAAAAGAHAMLDISDGLVRDAGRMAAASGVRIDLDPAAVARLAVPLETAAQLLGMDPRNWVLSGGEDHGLLAAFAPDTRLPEGFAAIGAVLATGDGPAGADTGVGSSGAMGAVTVGRQPPTAVGWDHFGENPTPRQ